MVTITRPFLQREGDCIDRTGEIRENNRGTKMKIIEYRSYDDIDVEFLDDFHFIKQHQFYINFKNGAIKNPYDVTVNGVGYIGVGKYKTTRDDNPKRHTDEYNTWVTMLYRCYCDEDTVYFKESSVCKEWLCYQNFADWYSQNKYEVKGRLHLDKDILFPGNKIYAPDKCILIPQRINMLFVNQMNKRHLPNGIIKRVHGYLAKYNDEELGVYKTLEDAYKVYSSKKKEDIIRVANEYKSIIPEKAYNALLAYEFDMSNDRNYMIAA